MAQLSWFCLQCGDTHTQQDLPPASSTALGVSTDCRSTHPPMKRGLNLFSYQDVVPQMFLTPQVGRSGRGKRCPI